MSNHANPFPSGGGKYEPECMHLLETLDASLVAVIVAKGNRGSGFAVAGKEPADMAVLAYALRAIADDIDAKIKALAS